MRQTELLDEPNTTESGIQEIPKRRRRPRWLWIIVAVAFITRRPGANIAANTAAGVARGRNARRTISGIQSEPRGPGQAALRPRASGAARR